MTRTQALFDELSTPLAVGEAVWCEAVWGDAWATPSPKKFPSGVLMHLELGELDQRTDETLQDFTQRLLDERLDERHEPSSLIWLSLGALDSLPSTRALLCEHPQALPFELSDPEVALMSVRVMLITQTSPLVVLDADPSELDATLLGEVTRSAPTLTRLCAQAGVSLLVLGRSSLGRAGREGVEVMSPLRRFAWSVGRLDHVGAS